MDERILKNEEKAVFDLRALYRRYGYRSFKMSKFEEYDLYLRHKDFLVSDRIVTFSDTNGRLMALKPDVTLSIIKNGEDGKGKKQKVYYNENVYRPSGSTHRFKEIMQTGLECIGDIDAYDVFEAVWLAAQSLATVSDRYILDISHLGLLSAFLDETGGDAEFRRKAGAFIAEKNEHDLKALGAGEKLCALARTHGEPDAVIAKLEPLCDSEAARAALRELKALASTLKAVGAGKVRFDFSIVNDMKYYNGIVFQGFLDGICESVLSGGQYDNLMKRMGRKARAVGFALYLDLLEELETPREDFEADILLLYDETVPIETLAAEVQKRTAAGQTVSVRKTAPEGGRFRQTVKLGEEARP